MSVSSDTVNLLRECNAGIKMGVSSIDEVLDSVKDNELLNILKIGRASCRERV